MSSAIDVNTVGGGLGPECAILLDKVSHGLLDVVFSVPLFLFFLLFLLFLLFLFRLDLLDGSRGWRRKLRLRLNLPDRRQRGVAAPLGIVSLNEERQEEW